MGRRFLFDRRLLDTDMVYSASSEVGLQLDGPVDTAVDGDIELFTGGETSITNTFWVDLIRGGNLGGAEWGFTPTDESAFFGCCRPWIFDEVNKLTTTKIGSQCFPIAVRRIDDPTLGAVAVACVNNDGDAELYRFNPSTGSWGSTVTVDSTYSGATLYPTVDIVHIPETGEVLAFFDGRLYEADTSNYNTSDAYKLRSDYTSWDNTNNSASMVYSRGMLIIVWADNVDHKVYCMRSFDRGYHWETPVAVSDDFVSGETINEADGVHVVVSPADGMFYMVVEDDSDGTGNADYAKVYKSGNGLDWEQTIGTIGNTTMYYPSLMVMEDGRFALMFGEETADRVRSYWLDPDGTLHNARGSATFGDAFDTVVQGAAGGGESFYGASGVDIGSRCCGVFNFLEVVGAVKDVVGFELRRWSNLSERYGYDNMSFVECGSSPTAGWGWTATGNAAAETHPAEYMLLTTDPIMNTTRHYATTTGVGASQPIKVKFKVECGDNCDMPNRRVGMRVKAEDAAGNGCDFGVYFDQTQVRIYDHQAAAWLGSDLIISPQETFRPEGQSSGSAYASAVLAETRGGSCAYAFG